MKRQSPPIQPPRVLRASDITSNLPKNRSTLSPSLAFPIKEDYWPLLAIKLIFAAAIYAGAGGMLLTSHRLVASWPMIVSDEQLLWDITKATMVSAAAATIFAGATTLICFLALPVASLLCSKFSLVRPGWLVGGLVGATLWLPMWMLSPAQLDARLFIILAFTTPLILLMQAAGLLAAPGDVVRRSATRKSRWITIRQLMVVVTAASVFTAIASKSPSALAIGLLVATWLALHWLARWPIESIVRWLLARRFARRRARRLEDCST